MSVEQNREQNGDQNQESVLGGLLKGFRAAGFFASAGNLTKHQSRGDANPRQILWAVRTLESGVLEISPLVAGFPAPASMRMAKKIERGRFLEQFWPEPDLFVRDALKSFAARDDLKGYPTSLKEVIRYYLPLVLVFLATGQRAKAETIIDFLITHNVPMCDKQKKLLNRVAVELRRDGNPEGALECYASVEKYYGEDAHLHFNIARTMWDMRKLDKCRAHLERCLEISPDLAIARQFLAKLDSLKKDASVRAAKKAVVIDSSYRFNS